MYKAQKMHKVSGELEYGHNRMTVSAASRFLVPYISEETRIISTYQKISWISN
jgi:hypothetical protein